MFNLASLVNGIIAGIIFSVYGYVTACITSLLSPIRSPLRLRYYARENAPDQLAPYSVLLLSCLLASATTTLANYGSFVGEAVREVSGAKEQTDVKLLAILIVGLLLFVACDLLARIGTGWHIKSGRRRSERIIAIRQYQISAVLAAVSLLYLGWPLVRALVPTRNRNPWIDFFWDHQWMFLGAIALLVIICAVYVTVRQARRPALSLRGSLAVASPSLICGLLLFYALSDAPYAYLLRRPEMIVSNLLKSSVNDTYPHVSFTRCTLQSPGTLSVSALLVNTSKDNVAVDLRYAVIGFAQGYLPGYFDQDVYWFSSPSSISSFPGGDAGAPFALMKPGDSIALKVIFHRSEQYAAALEAIKRWQSEGKTEDYSYFYGPACFLSLRFVNINQGAQSVIPDFNKKEGFWDELRKTDAGIVRLMP